MKRSKFTKLLIGSGLPFSKFWQKKLKEWILRQHYLTLFVRGYRLYTMARVPPEVCIETTSICNSHCVMCPIDKLNRPKKPMDMDLFRKIVDDCTKSGVRCIKLHNYGEPFMTPGFEKMLHYIRTKNPNIEIQFASNGLLLNEKWAHVVINEKVNRISVTVDGAGKETYEKIRIGLKYDTVVKNIRDFMDFKKEIGAEYPELYVSIIHMEETKEELEHFVKQWTDVVDQVVITKYSTRAGELPGNEFCVEPKPCFRLWKQMVVTNTGEVATCCADWNCKSVLGNVRTQTLSDIWQDKAVKRLRLMHLEGRASEIPLCTNCNPGSWDSFPEWWFKVV